MNDSDVVREIDLECDGTVYTIRKTTKKKFAKNRQTGEMVFKGNEDSWEIDGFPYKKTEYQKWLGERLDAEAWNFCFNAQVFIGQVAKSTVTARKTLLTLSRYSPDDFAKQHQEFSDVIEMLKGHTPDELKKVLNKNLKLASSRIELATSSINMLKQLDDTVPVNPDRAGLVTELERFKKAEVEKSKKLSKLLAEDAPSPSDIMSQIHEIVIKENDEIVKAYNDINGRIISIDAKIRKGEAELTEHSSEFSEAKRQYEANGKAIAGLKDTLLKTQMASYQGDNVCPTCGQPLPKKAVQKAVDAFIAQNKKDEQNLTNEITLLESRNEKLKERMLNVQQKYRTQKTLVSSLNSEKEKLQKEVDALPVSKTAQDIPEAVELQKKLNELMNNKQIINILNDDLRSLSDSIFRVEKRIRDIDFEAEMKQREIDADKQRLVDQQNELKAAQAEYGNIMSTLDRLSEYSIASNKCLEDHVNQFFTHFKFSLFDYTQAGDTVETCKMLVNGIPYDNGLNHGDRILCEIDLVKGFQKMLNVNVPIFVDDSESVDMDRIPKLDNQLIILRRTDEKELTVTNL